MRKKNINKKKTFNFVAVNRNGQLELYIDGKMIDPSRYNNFMLQGWYIPETNLVGRVRL